MKKLKIVLILIFLSSYSFAQYHNKSVPISDSDFINELSKARQKLKNYAFTICLEGSYEYLDSGFCKRISDRDEIVKNDSENVIREKFKNFMKSHPQSNYIKFLDSLFKLDGSQGGYFQTNLWYGRKTLDSVSIEAIIWAKKKYKSYENKNTLVVMKCLDFYNSKELDDLVKSFDYEVKQYYDHNGSSKNE